MKNVKKIHKVYAVWDFELEIEELNLQSEQGWQLVEGKLFSRTYEKDSSILYRYQLDYNSSDDTMYQEMFREQGWEYVNSTINGWNYFRKEVKDELDEEDYSIYTDVDSKERMNRRFLKFMVLVFAAVFFANFQHLFRFMEAPKIATSGILLVIAIYLFFLIKSVVGLKRFSKGERARKRTPVGIYFLLLVIATVFMVSGMSSDITTKYEMQISEEKKQTFTYEVDFSDIYYFSLNKAGLEEENGAVELSIINEEGKEIYHNSAFVIEDKRVGMFLRSGSYQCIIDGEIDSNVTIEIR